MPQPQSLGDALRPVRLSMTRKSSGESGTNKRKASGSDRPTSSEPAACPVCQGAGYVRRVVRYDHADFGKLIECSACDTLMKRRLSILERFSSLRGDLLKCDFTHFRVVEGADSAYEAAIAFARAPTGWLVLHGPNGSGKTHLAAAIALNLRAKGKPVLFMRVPDLMEFLRHAYDEESLFVRSVGQAGSMNHLERLETVRRAPILVLDDLAAESDTPWVREKLYQILDYRGVDRLPTVVTLNIGPSEWAEKLGARVADRLGNRLIARVVYNAARSFRQSKENDVPGGAG
jgi:DNA replication protein DnaC